MTVNKRYSSATCNSLSSFGTSIFTDMTKLANKYDATNLSQGFPDFDGPLEIRKIAANAILKGPNQYSATIGVSSLRNAISKKMTKFYNVNVDLDTEVTVLAGASEGLAATLLGLLNPGDEVILLEPNYDLYPAMISRAGCKAVYVSLEQPDFSIPEEKLAKAFGAKTKAIVINNPQNPCGKVFSEKELNFIADLCIKHDVIAIGDEVYEHIVFDNKKHITLLQIEKLKNRAVVISSTAKTFSMTGWKVGYTVAAPHLTDAIRMAHQFMTYCTPSAFQEAMAFGILMDDSYYTQLLSMYEKKREWFCEELEKMNFTVLKPKGTYYISLDISDLEFEDDLAFCNYLAADVGVAAIPASFFWKDRRDGKNLVRLCFCKKDDTLREAILRLKKWRSISL